MSHFFSGSRGTSTLPWYTAGEKMSDENLEQQINVTFCVKIGKNASESSVLLTLARGEYSVKNLGAQNDKGGSRKGGKVCRMTQEVGSQNAKDRCEYGQSPNLGCNPMED
jgi:hypothetical protein